MEPMNRKIRRAHDRQVRRAMKHQAEHYDPEGQGVVLMGAVELRHFGAKDEPIVVLSAKNAGGSCTVGLTVPDVEGLVKGLELTLEDVELSKFVQVVRDTEDAKAAT